MSENMFYLELTEGEALTVLVHLTGQQVQDMLLDGVDPLLETTIIEVLAQNESLAKKIQYFLNSADKDAEVAFTTHRKHLKGRPVYEVPFGWVGREKRPCVPQREQYKGTFFWNILRTRVCIVADFAMAEALEKQETARYIGVADYAEGGIGIYEWEPND